MDVANLTAGWISALVTTVGLSSIITQARAIQNQLDPFHGTRTREHLGAWFSKQKSISWFSPSRPPPIGPHVTGQLSVGFCGHKNLFLSRLPIGHTGKASWTVMLAVLHVPMAHTALMEKHQYSHKEHVINVTILENPMGHSGSPLTQDYSEAKSLLSWKSLSLRPLVYHQGIACIAINCATFVTHMVLINARLTYKYSDAAGLRAAYHGYSGVWRIEWPLGGKAVAKFSPYDSHRADTDVYPPFIPRRVDKCINMYVGIVGGHDDAGPFKIAFASRVKNSGCWVLQEHKGGFGGTNNSTGLYNMVGGKVFEVDMLFRRPVKHLELISDGPCMKLEIPSRAPNQLAHLFIPEHEQRIILAVLDHLPWGSLPWALHWGMKDILLAFGKPVMDSYRIVLAKTLKGAINDNRPTLRMKGWERNFIQNYMGDMAASAIISGHGNSGDVVRVATDAALLVCGDRVESELDTTTFWRTKASAARAPDFIFDATEGLDQDSIIALTKFFVLEWSYDLDYRLHEGLPSELLVG